MKTMTFESWMRAVDGWCYRLCGMSAHDLDDICYRDMYDDGCAPRAAARRAIRNAGGCNE